MMNTFRNFLKDEDGAVTVDWVVLTAGAAFISVLIIGGIQSAANDVSSGVGAAITSYGDESLD